MSAESVLSIAGLTWQAGGRHILGPLDLEVSAGEFLAFVGPNGAGKTTLLRLIAGVLRPAAGELAYRGRRYGRLAWRALARHVAYVPQVSPAVALFTVEDAVLLGRFPHFGRFQLAPTAQDLAAVERALATCGIEDLRRRRLDELSGGERQVVHLAACLAQESEVLVLDEPTTHLDPRHQRRIADILRHLTRDAGKTVVTATHDLNFAALLASRVAALLGGRILATGTPAELLEPDLLGRLFAAPFKVVANGGRPLVLPHFA